MKTLIRAVATCACLAAFRFFPAPAHAEALEAKQPPVLPFAARFFATTELRLGATTAPYFTRDFPEVRGHGLIALLSAGHRLDERHSIAAEVPLLAISVQQPAGSYLDDFTWGNFNLSYRYECPLLDAPSSRMRLHAGASLGLPIAEQSRSPALLAGRALRIGSALDGYRHPELYVEGVLPIAGSVGVTFARSWFGADASLRLPLLIRVSDAHLPDDARTQPLGVMLVLHAGLSAAATGWLNLSMAADIVFDAVPAVETARRTPAAQLTLSPALTFLLPRDVQLGASFVLPLAGALGGTTYAGGLVLAYRR